LPEKEGVKGNGEKGKSCPIMVRHCQLYQSALPFLETCRDPDITPSEVQSLLSSQYEHTNEYIEQFTLNTRRQQNGQIEPRPPHTVGSNG
jgi:hypothetical protein